MSEGHERKKNPDFKSAQSESNQSGEKKIFSSMMEIQDEIGRF